MRRRVAQLLGFSEFREMDLRTQLLSSPAAVDVFLADATAALRPRVAEDLKILQHPPPWDVLARLRSASQHGARLMPALAKFLTTESIIGAAEVAAAEIFGIHFEVDRGASAAELWHPSVVKAVAVHPSRGRLGVVYLDLFSRPGKFASSATQALATGHRDGDAHREPRVVMSLSFSPKPQRSLGEFTVLMHEFGHVLHGLIARTEFQHYGGIRCPTDMVELPSVLFESFSRCPEFLHRTLSSSGERISAAESQALATVASPLPGLSTAASLHGAMLDQAMHSAEPLERSPFDVAADLWRQLGADANYGFASIAEAHLAHYGARFYSYLYCEVLARTLRARHLPRGPGSGRGDFGEEYYSFLELGGAASSEDVARLVGGAPLDAAVLADG